MELLTELKIGDLVQFRPDEPCDGKHLGESHDFHPDLPYRVDRMNGNCTTMLSGIPVAALNPNRFIKYVGKQEINNSYEIY